jgi:CRISPR-associated protein Cmr1
MNKSKLTATFRIVTPMFLSGADKTKAELRVPSIKGALRFWWRALQWAKIQDVKKLREAEAELFGSSDQNVGQSRIRINLVTSGLYLKTHTPPEWKIGDRQNGWKCYSGYGVHEGKRQCIEAGQEFSIKIVLGEQCTEIQVDQLKKALQILGLIGGLGSRARNGWGSVTLIKLEDWQAPYDSQELKSTFQNLTHSEAEPAPFTAFCGAAELRVGKVHKSAEHAHKAIVETYQSTKAKDSGVTKEDRVELGLPRDIKKTHFRDQSERRASPLFLHVHQAADGDAIPMALWLPTNPWHPTVALPGEPARAPKFVLKFATSVET